MNIIDKFKGWDKKIERSLKWGGRSYKEMERELLDKVEIR